MLDILMLKGKLQFKRGQKIIAYIRYRLGARCTPPSVNFFILKHSEKSRESLLFPAGQMQTLKPKLFEHFNQPMRTSDWAQLTKHRP